MGKIRFLIGLVWHFLVMVYKALIISKICPHYIEKTLYS